MFNNILRFLCFQTTYKNLNILKLPQCKSLIVSKHQEVNLFKSFQNYLFRNTRRVTYEVFKFPYLNVRISEKKTFIPTRWIKFFFVTKTTTSDPWAAACTLLKNLKSYCTSFTFFNEKKIVHIFALETCTNARIYSARQHFFSWNNISSRKTGAVYQKRYTFCVAKCLLNFVCLTKIELNKKQINTHWIMIFYATFFVVVVIVVCTYGFLYEQSEFFIA